MSGFDGLPRFQGACCVWICWEPGTVTASECPWLLAAQCCLNLPFVVGDSCAERQQQLCQTSSSPDEDRHLIVFLVIVNDDHDEPREPLWLPSPCRGTYGLVRDGLGGHRTGWPPLRNKVFSNLKHWQYRDWNPIINWPLSFPKGFCVLLIFIYIVSKPICLFKQIILRPKKYYKWNYSHISSMTSLWELLFPLLACISNF